MIIITIATTTCIVLYDMCASRRYACWYTTKLMYDAH